MMRITLVAFGTRGEVQPYIALGLALQAAGHTVKIVTIGQLHELVSAYGLTSIEIPFHSFSESQVTSNNTVPLWVMYQTAQKLIRQTLAVIWEACQDAEAIIFHQMARVAMTHVVEKLNVPAFIVIFHPYHLRFILYQWREINRYGEPRLELSEALRQQAEWLMFKGPINRWRREVLGLPQAPFWGNDELIKARQIPVFCAYSPLIFPKRSEWPAWFHVTGYYFLNSPEGWQPPQALAQFLDSGPPPVYIGFGSLLRQGNVQNMTDVALQALKASGQRGILAAGWSNFGQRSALPPTVLAIESAPHDWLFPRMAAVVHHGGAGTTAAGIRAGVPSILIPVVWDQPFWGQRVASLGIGPPPISPKQLTAERLAAAIEMAVHDRPMRERALQFGAQIRAEDGLGKTLALLESYWQK
ncbi:MAG TPA: glycosyltransferase [Anaerolineae bacterium]|nr:glycosyltransferase [Anaerolineae bacterium]